MVITQIIQTTQHTIQGMFSVSIPILLLHTQVLIKGLVRLISFNTILLILTEGMSFPLVTLFITSMGLELLHILAQEILGAYATRFST